MLRRLPVFPLFGRGQTQLQPAYVEDVADAIARVMQNTQSPMCYELGGPRVYAYRSLLEVIARHLGIKPLLISIPFGLWHAFASVAEMLLEPPARVNQVELLQLDSVASPGAPGFGDLGISSTSLEDALPHPRACRQGPSAFLTHSLSDWAVQPIFAAIEVTVAHREE